MTVDDAIEAGDHVVTHWRAEGRGKRSGVDVDMDGYCVFTMSGSKVQRVEFFDSRRSALRAGGVRPA